jgi:long-subunit fatty acid transport protein
VAGNLLGSASYESDDVEVDFPMAFGFGASWRPQSPLTLSADYTRTDWSESTIRNYFVLAPQRPPFPDEDVLPTGELPYPTLLQSQVDTEQFRAGVEYVVLWGRVRWPLRAGFFTDRQLFHTYDPATGTSSKVPSLHGVAAGTGIIIGRVLADIAWVYEWGDYLEAPSVNAPDIVPTVDVRSHRVFISLIYRHR